MAAHLPVALLAERDPYIVQQIKKALHGLVDMTVVSGGAEALATARALKPDVIIIEVLLPDFDGYQLCRRLRDDNVMKNTPILLISVFDSSEVAMRAGSDAFLVKPLDDDRLREVIARLLSEAKAA